VTPPTISDGDQEKQKGTLEETPSPTETWDRVVRGTGKKEKGRETMWDGTLHGTVMSLLAYGREENVKKSMSMGLLVGSPYINDVDPLTSVGPCPFGSGLPPLFMALYGGPFQDTVFRGGWTCPPPLWSGAWANGTDLSRSSLGCVWKTPHGFDWRECGSIPLPLSTRRVQH
jgi:hypothetical protein